MRVSSADCRHLLLACLAFAVLSALHGVEAHAQARNPFNVGISEGGGQASGIAGWILAKQIAFERMMSASVRAVRTSATALWTLVGISFAYGVFHAAGPGHGKAVVASYMLANERALRRGLAISFLAALLQGLVAIAIVGGLAWLLHATAQHMKESAQLVEIASFAGIAVLGAWLTWRKGRTFVEVWRTPPKLRAQKPMPASRFACEACADDEVHEHGPDCGHFHMPDPRQLTDRTFSWRDAALTVLAAGVRPCSGAILILVFSLAQGLFYAGVLATFAMALGTAITTGALAALAVLAKEIALRLTREESPRRILALRGLELLAAVAVLTFGVLLLLGYTAAAM
jgi:nickel/cobalt exporter